MTDVNHSMNRRRDERDNPAIRQSADITNLMVNTWQPALQIMATLFHAYGQGLRGMAEGFEDVRDQQEQQEQQRKKG